MSRRLAVMLFAMALVAVIILRISLRSMYGPESRAPREIKSAPLVQPAPAVVPPLKHPHRGRPIVASGIHSLPELFAAMHDPAVRENFRGFDFDSARLTVLDHSVLAFIAYRIDGHGVYWSTAPALLLRGEIVWRDQFGNLLRARCGNRAALAPAFPVSPENENPDAILSAEESPATFAPVTPTAAKTGPSISPVYYLPPVGGPLGGVGGGVPVSSADNPMPNLFLCGVFCFAVVKMVRSLRRYQ